MNSENFLGWSIVALCFFIGFCLSVLVLHVSDDSGDCYDAKLVIEVFEACQSDDACRDRLTMDDLLDYERAKREVEKC